MSICYLGWPDALGTGAWRIRHKADSDGRTKLYFECGDHKGFFVGSEDGGVGAPETTLVFPPKSRTAFGTMAWTPADGTGSLQPNTWYEVTVRVSYSVDLSGLGPDSTPDVWHLRTELSVDGNTFTDPPQVTYHATVTHYDQFWNDTTTLTVQAYTADATYLELSLYTDCQEPDLPGNVWVSATSVTARRMPPRTLVTPIIPVGFLHVTRWGGWGGAGPALAWTGDPAHTYILTFDGDDTQTHTVTGLMFDAPYPFNETRTSLTVNVYDITLDQSVTETFTCPNLAVTPESVAVLLTDTGARVTWAWITDGTPCAFRVRVFKYMGDDVYAPQDDLEQTVTHTNGDALATITLTESAVYKVSVQSWWGTWADGSEQYAEPFEFGA